METHSSILAWRIPWTEELGGLQSMGCRRVGHNLADNNNLVRDTCSSSLPFQCLGLWGSSLGIGPWNQNFPGDQHTFQVTL